MPDSPLDEQARHYLTVASAIEFIRTNALRQPSLDEIAAAVHMSPFHLQRVFASWAGISPKRFLQYLTKDFARQELARSADLLSVASSSGLSGTSRLHDLMISCEAMTPGEIKAGGKGVSIGFGLAPTPFGEALLGWTPRGLCHLMFRDRDDDAMVSELATQWPAAILHRDDAEARSFIEKVFPVTPERGKLHLVLRGTNFQIKVWEALIRVRPAAIVSYGDLARRSDAPKAQRAVGSALAANRIAYLIPCHRVIRESGEPGHYRWGSSRKLAILGWEAGHRPEAMDSALQ